MADVENDPARYAIKLLKTPDGMPDLFRRLIPGCTFEDPKLLELAYYLLARPRLKDFKIDTHLSPSGIPQALESTVVFATLELLSDLDLDYPRAYYVRACKGFEQFFDRPDWDYEREMAILQTNETKKEAAPFNFEKTAFRIGLDFLLLPIERTFNNDLPEIERLPVLQKEEAAPGTEQFILKLHTQIKDTFGSRFWFHRIQVLYETMAFMRRFERNKWQVEPQDVLDAWRRDYRRRKWPLRIQDTHRKEVLGTLFDFNGTGIYPSQRKIRLKSGLNPKWVWQELNKDTGTSILKGYVETCNPRGYKLTDRGRRLYLNDYSIQVDDVIYRPEEDVKE